MQREWFWPWPDPPWIERNIAPRIDPSNLQAGFCGPGHTSTVGRVVARFANFRADRYGLIPLMFQPLEWFIGLRYLRSRRWRALVSFRTAASLIGLALGVTA